MKVSEDFRVLDRTETWASTSLGGNKADSEYCEMVGLEEMRSRIVTGSDILDLPGLEWIIPGVLPRPALVVLYGPPKAGKTFVALDLALRVASGSRWIDRPTEACPVLYVIGEGTQGIKQRLESWIAIHQPGTDAPRSIHWLPGALNLSDPSEVNLVSTLARELGVGLVIIDTLARCAVGVDENSSQEMGEVIKNIDFIKAAAQCTVLLVHHTGKDPSKGMRGSNALLGAVDASLLVTGKHGSVTFKVEVAKDFESGLEARFRLEGSGESVALVHTKPDGPSARASTSTRVKGTAGNQPRPKSKATALDTLRAAVRGEGLTTEEWKARSGLAASTFYRVRGELARDGAARSVTSGADTRWYAST